MEHRSVWATEPGLKAKRAINSQPHSWRPGQSHRTGWTTLANWSQQASKPASRTMANSDAAYQLTSLEDWNCTQDRTFSAPRTSSINRALLGPYQLRSVFAAWDFAFFFSLQPPRLVFFSLCGVAIKICCISVACTTNYAVGDENWSNNKGQAARQHFPSNSFHMLSLSGFTFNQSLIGHT